MKLRFSVRHNVNTLISHLKAALKWHTPSVYKILCTIKDKIFPPKRLWGKYYDASPAYEWLHRPEQCLIELKQYFPANIDTLLNLGSGAGRDFIPFDGELKLWALDIVPFERINWLRPFKNMTYTQSYLEDFTTDLEQRKYDLRNVLVYSHGTMMYLSKDAQERFFAACRSAGATMFIFSEYAFGTRENEEYFKLDPSHFTVLRFRPEGDTLTYTTLPVPTGIGM